MVAKRNLMKNVANIHGAREVGKKEFKRKASVKEKEQATNEKVANKSEPNSASALEDDQD